MTNGHKTLAFVISVIGTMSLDDVISIKLAGCSKFWRCSLPAMVSLEMIILYITTELPNTLSLSIAELCMMSCTVNFDSEGLFLSSLCYLVAWAVKQPFPTDAETAKGHEFNFLHCQDKALFWLQERCVGCECRSVLYPLLGFMINLASNPSQVVQVKQEV